MMRCTSKDAKRLGLRDALPAMLFNESALPGLCPSASNLCPPNVPRVLHVVSAPVHDAATKLVFLCAVFGTLASHRSSLSSVGACSSSSPLRGGGRRPRSIPLHVAQQGALISGSLDGLHDGDVLHLQQIAHEQPTRSPCSSHLTYTCSPL